MMQHLRTFRRLWKSRRAVQIRLVIGVLLLAYVGRLYMTHQLAQVFALLYAAVILVLMSLDICSRCGLPWMIQPIALIRGACRRCEQELP